MALTTVTATAARADHDNGIMDPIGVCTGLNQTPGGVIRTDNDTWDWNYQTTVPNVVAALNNSFNNIYGPQTDLTIAMKGLSSSTDMVAAANNYTTLCGELWDLPDEANIAGKAVCISKNTAGACQRHNVYFDRSDTDGMPTAQLNRLACHELGHALGLTHANEDTESGNHASDPMWDGCMFDPVEPEPAGASAHDLATVDFTYVSHGTTYEARAATEIRFNAGLEPDVTDRSNNRVDVAITDPSGAVWHRPVYAGGGSPTIIPNGSSYDSPTIVSWGGDRLDVFIRGLDNGLWHAYNNGAGWSAWSPLGGTITSEPDVASWGTDRLDVFARGLGGGLYHRAWDGVVWQAWEPLGGSLAGNATDGLGPGAVSRASNRIDIAVTGTDGRLYQMQWAPGWTSFTPMTAVGTSFASAPDLAARDANRLDVFAEGNDNDVWHAIRTSPTGPWTGLENLDRSPDGGITATWRGTQFLEVLANSHDDTLRHWYYDNNTGRW